MSYPLMEYLLTSNLQIKAAVSAVRSVRGLPLAEGAQNDAGGHKDLFERLQCWFGFQVDRISYAFCAMIPTLTYARLAWKTIALLMVP